MIDSHCHLDFDCFDADREQVLKCCTELGIERILIPGTEPSRFDKLLLLQQQYSNSNLYPALDIAFGLHPYFLSENSDKELEALEHALIKHREKLVAVGEIGLDYGLIEGLIQRDLDDSRKVDKATQQKVFIAQLELAKQYELPVILHHRKSHNDLIRFIKQTGFEFGGVIHAFSGSLQIAQQYIDMGFKLGVGGTITYPRAQKTRETIAQIPLEHLLLETDAPDMPIYGRQGARNSPEYLGEIADSLAELKRTSLKKSNELLSKVFNKLFLY